MMDYKINILKKNFLKLPVLSRILVGGVVVGLGFGLYNLSFKTIVSNAVAAEDGAVWGYKGETGPTRWGDLAPEFSTCKLGKEQSPINIDTNKVVKHSLPAIMASYKIADGEIVNNGHTIQVNLTSAGNARLSDGQYQLLQFHFHTPSEEKIDNKNFVLVNHLVHKNATGNLAVVAVLYKKGKENAALKNIFANMPGTKGQTQLKNKFDAKTLLPNNLSYYNLKGSLTVPPCTEGVSWHIVKEPLEISEEQLKSFQKIFAMNARPVQSLNDRVVKESQ